MFIQNEKYLAFNLVFVSLKCFEWYMYVMFTPFKLILAKFAYQSLAISYQNLSVVEKFEPFNRLGEKLLTELLNRQKAVYVFRISPKKLLLATLCLHFASIFPEPSQVWR